MTPVTWKTKSVTAALKQMAAEVHSALPDGTELTRAQALAKLIWDKALGYSRVITDSEGKAKEVTFPAEAWAINCCLDRLDGKLGPGVAEETTKTPIAERVSDLGKRRINSLVVDGVTKERKGPPKIE